MKLTSVSFVNMYVITSVMCTADVAIFTKSLRCTLVIWLHHSVTI